MLSTKKGFVNDFYCIKMSAKIIDKLNVKSGESVTFFTEHVV